MDPGEVPEVTAVREVREEAGINTEIIAPIQVVEYWYVSQQGQAKVRFHKFVHFYLLKFFSGDVRDHDNEVHDARWINVDEAVAMLAFQSEKAVVRRAMKMCE